VLCARRSASPKEGIVTLSPTAETATNSPLLKTSGVHHVSINVSDVAAATHFYTEVLGLPLRSDRPEFSFDGAWIDIGNQQLHLIAGDVPDALGQHFAFEVADLDAAVADLRAKGITITDPRPVGARRQSFFHDPCGNYLELLEVTPD
jgi:glyoxylase I family protein